MRARLDTTLPTSSWRSGPDGAEMHRARIAVEDFGDVGEIDRRVAALELVGAGEVLDEAAQAEAVEIARRLRATPPCLSSR